MMATNSELKPCECCGGCGLVGGFQWCGASEGSYEEEECPHCKGTGKDRDSEAHHEE